MLHGREALWQSTIYHKFPVKVNDDVALAHGKFSRYRHRRWHAKVFKGFVLAISIATLLAWSKILHHPCLFESLSAYSNPLQESVFNTTLGFQKLFLISLPDRPDRRTPLLAAADATNLTVSVIDAVRDRQIALEARPDGWSTDDFEAKEGELGCLMSHLRTWKKIIHENITSALIMESDVDWDVRLKQSLPGVARGTRAIVDWPFDPEPLDLHGREGKQTGTLESASHSPYGDKWDLIWLGHCGSSANGDGRIYNFQDSSAPNDDRVWVFGPQPADGVRKPGTRIVYQVREAICTTAYAISNQGARKFEKIFRKANRPLDFEMWNACANNAELACVGVFPQLFSMTESRTNIKHTEGGLPFGHEVTKELIVAGKGIQVSARVNAELGLVRKGPAAWKWEWSDVNETEQKGRTETVP